MPSIVYPTTTLLTPTESQLHPDVRMTPTPEFHLSRWLFLRLLAFVYLLAFASLAPQVVGLIGREGLLPVDQFLDRAHEFYNADAYLLLPTLLWFSPSSNALLMLCWSGVLLSLLALVGGAPTLTFAVLWAVYLSLTVAGQTFLSFQWDVLLLEVGLLACLYAPLGWWPRLSSERRPPPLLRWLIWVLAFKVTFLSGVTKLVSGDDTWRALTALMFHYETQPIPAWTSWFAHHMPDWIQMASVLTMFVIELVVPFAALAPIRFRRVRAGACALMCLLQVGIGLTGNYGFFNLLTIVLYLALLDDRHISGILLASIAERPRAIRSGRPEPRSWRILVLGAGSTILLMTTLSLWHEMTYTRPHPEWSNRLIGYVQPFRSINGYGLFRTMTTERPEIVVEGSSDGVTWTEYAFRSKPGNVDRRPGFVQPHMPRLDWLMWFAALDPLSHQHWLATLVDHLLDGTPTVRDLLDEDPFPNAPPRFVRLALYQYHFTTPDEKAETGNWWRRELRSYLTDTISHR